ncbi:MAG: hypothetical protein FWE40_05340 [Oscillospiraceae bacterium]|jgi:hypothetical protein|nr:hypothetical protein [Oscillospiraceae bacterium]
MNIAEKIMFHLTHDPDVIGQYSNWDLLKWLGAAALLGAGGRAAYVLVWAFV